MSKSRSASNSKSTKCDKEGYLHMMSADSKNSVKSYVILSQNILQIYSSNKDAKPHTVYNLTVLRRRAAFLLQGCSCRDIPSRIRNKYCFELTVIVSGMAKELEARSRVSFVTDEKNEMQNWLAMIQRSSMTVSFPENCHFEGTPDQRELFHPLDKLSDTGQKGRYSSLYKKLIQCSYVFGFEDELLFEAEKTLKRETLLELTECFETLKGLFTDYRSLSDAVKMIGCNIFRVLPKKKIVPMGEEYDELDFTDPQWPHLSLVYNFFLSLVTTNHIDQNSLRKVFDVPFISRLIELFNSEDNKEREIVKTITHRIYGKLTHRRTIIRQTFYNTIHQYVYESHEHNGIAEMLEILASIINGLGLPIRDEHIVTLSRTLIPLHKMDRMEDYYPQLSYCMILFAKKDTALSVPIVLGILKYWPVGNSSKEMDFLTELEDIIEIMDLDSFMKVLKPYQRRLAKCFGSVQFQIVEKSLLTYNKPKMAQLLIDTPQVREQILPVIFPVLLANSRHHWTEIVRQLSHNVLNLYNAVDQNAIERLMSGTTAPSK